MLNVKRQMILKTNLVIALLCSGLLIFAEDQPCGSVFFDAFDTDGAAPEVWTEYNTSGQVTVEGGRLKFDYTPDHPSAYRTFEVVSKDFAYSFDVESTRNWVTAKMHLMSSSGKYLASIVFGNDGVKNIQYATALDDMNKPGTYAGGLIDGSYNKDVSYSLGLTADFEHQTIALYFDGILKVSDIPFLEQATDFARIEIEQLAMYNGEGRFFFDNISLTAEDVNRAELSAAIANVNASLARSEIGTVYGQYPQATYVALAEKINEVMLVVADCNASQTEIDLALERLETTFANFNSSMVDEVVLKLFSDYGFTGEEKDYRCGYYNGNLGTFDNAAVSFRLEKGYMVTFAEENNGLGFSKVYVAADNDLEINLPLQLQKTVSFIRVSPWIYSKKKSICSGGPEIKPATNCTWFYDWGGASEPYGDMEYVPMTWGKWFGSEKLQELGSTMYHNHHLAFNEPDGAEQANMTVDEAITKYALLQESGLRLGSPAVTDGAKGKAWRDEFMTKALDADLRIDFIAVHYYKKTTAMNYYNWLKAIYDLYQRPIWVTEFNYGATWTWDSGPTMAQYIAGLSSYVYMLDTCSFIERYNIFNFNNSALSLYTQKEPVILNEAGEYYRDFEDAIAYTQQLYEQGPQSSTGLQSMSGGKVSLYPNPASDAFTVSNAQGAVLELFDVQGKRVISNSVKSNAHKVEMHHLSAGMYVVRITKAGVMSNHKLVKNEER